MAAAVQKAGRPLAFNVANRTEELRADLMIQANGGRVNLSTRPKEQDTEEHRDRQRGILEQIHMWFHSLYLNTSLKNP